MEKNKSIELKNENLQSVAEDLVIVDVVKSYNESTKAKNRAQPGLNGLLNGLSSEVALAVYEAIINSMKQKGVTSFPKTYRELVNVLAKDSKIEDGEEIPQKLVLEDFTNKGIPKEAVVQILLNLMIGPVQIMKDSIDKSE